jgi:mono/diheme cytochrome c family protein
MGHFSYSISIVLVILVLTLLVVGCTMVVVPEGGASGNDASAELLVPPKEESAPTSASATALPTSTPAPTPTAAAEPAVVSGGEANVASEELVAQGLVVYRKQYCGICHELEAAGTVGRFGPTHNGIGATAEQRIGDPHYMGKATTAAEYIWESLVDPRVYIVDGYVTTPHVMPPFTHLNKNDLEALVAFLMNQQ